MEYDLLVHVEIVELFTPNFRSYFSTIGVLLLAFLGVEALLDELLVLGKALKLNSTIKTKLLRTFACAYVLASAEFRFEWSTSTNSVCFPRIQKIRGRIQNNILKQLKQSNGGRIFPTLSVERFDYYLSFPIKKNTYNNLILDCAHLRHCLCHEKLKSRGVIIYVY